MKLTSLTGIAADASIRGNMRSFEKERKSYSLPYLIRNPLRLWDIVYFELLMSTLVSSDVNVSTI